ncbi:hypothetical protein CL176_10215 [Suicoccus acidiformans]|uniref:Uncharacterized protein n=1 Tax=Suicoccus acidiformans TaxID=2036206 RepID=A0A347WMN3_9LACT|nr:hypothetical protein [Suicoccus acidiformans]AXY26340.1 hypothetical protein CL176_10215 [Suicoccus acidiformans]
MTSLHLRGIIHLFYVDENRISQEDSILLPKGYTNNTLVISAILFLLYGYDFSEYSEEIKKEIKNAKKIAIREYIKNKQNSYAESYKALDDKLKSIAGSIDGISVEELSNQLTKLENKLQESMDKRQNILIQIKDLNSVLYELEVLSSRYDALKTQYVSDIKRLTLILEGEQIHKELSEECHDENCPFCDQPIEYKGISSYKETVNNELLRLIKQANDLEKTIKEVVEDKSHLRKQISQLRVKKDEINSKISFNLSPLINDIKDTISQITEYEKIDSQLQSLQKIVEDWNDDLIELEKEDRTKTLEFLPKSYFDDSTIRVINNLLNKIL